MCLSIVVSPSTTAAGHRACLGLFPSLRPIRCGHWPGVCRRHGLSRLTTVHAYRRLAGCDALLAPPRSENIAGPIVRLPTRFRPWLLQQQR